MKKIYAVLVRSTCLFLKLRYRKNINRCGTKHMSKLTYLKHTIFGLFMEIGMSKKYVRRCGTKYISKSKYVRCIMLGLLLEVEKSKECVLL